MRLPTLTSPVGLCGVRGSVLCGGLVKIPQKSRKHSSERAMAADSSATAIAVTDSSVSPTKCDL